MRVSQLYGLTGTQGTFDFIDVDVDRDTALFIDPAALAHVQSPWAQSCVSAIQGFFQRVLDRIVAGDRRGARELLSHLGEENATHLGYSSISKGSGVGPGLAERFYDELSTSAAVASGLITDLEDTALLIEGVREDRVSDVVTNIIRRQLAEYTEQTALFHGIPLNQGVAIGRYWDVATSRWAQSTFDLPVTTHGPLLLVPKAIVRRSLHLNPSQYYRHYVLEYFRQQELNNAQSSLAYLLKSGRRTVNKKDVEKKIRGRNQPGVPGIEKRINVAGTQQNPDLLSRYKEDKASRPPRPLSHEAMAESTASTEPDVDALLAAVLQLTPGARDAHKYERAVEALLSALLYPSLVSPVREEKIHDGRKRIDIAYTNTGAPGDFFGWLSQHYPAATVIAECKNYDRPLANPEYDQIAGRFSPSRGKYGLLVYRSIEDKAKLQASCKDTANDDRGFITALDDDDLKTLVAEYKADGSAVTLGGLLHTRFKQLIT